MGCRFGKALRAAFVAVLVALAAAEPAHALGDAGLDRSIVTNPVPGWRPSPPAQVHTVVTALTRLEVAAASSFGGSAAVAAQSWQDPSSPRSTLLIALVRVSAKRLQPSAMHQELLTGAAVAADTACEGATAKPPVSQSEVPSIPGSHHALCATAPNGTTPSGVTFAKGNVLALLFTSALSADRIDAIAGSQYAALSAVDSSVSSSSGGSLRTVVIIVLVVAAATALGLTIGVRRRHKSDQAEPDLSDVVVTAPGSAPGGEADSRGPPAGMYPDPSNAGRTRYWTGRDWGPESPPE